MLLKNVQRASSCIASRLLMHASACRSRCEQRFVCERLPSAREQRLLYEERCGCAAFGFPFQHTRPRNVTADDKTKWCSYSKSTSISYNSVIFPIFRRRMLLFAGLITSQVLGTVNFAMVSRASQKGSQKCLSSRTTIRTHTGSCWQSSESCCRRRPAIIHYFL